MVDAVVSYLVQRLGDFLIEKAVFLKEVRNEVEWLKDELRYMQRFLKDAEDKQYEDTTIRGWVSDIRELAYDIEDLLDTFHLEVHGVVVDDDEGTVERRPKLGCFPSICSCICAKGKEQVNLYNMGKEIEKFKNKINELSRRRQLYELQDSGNSGEGRSKTLGRLRDIRRVTSFAVEENVVGFDDDAHMLLDKLLNSDPQRFVVSIYGMGGLGKTTLAGKLYHNVNVRKRFDCHAWVYVSQDYSIRDLLQRVTKSFEFGTIKIKELEKMDEEDLGRYLYRSLKERSYMVVIDDVWNKEAWASLKRAFPDNGNGSRVIITTRNKEVAERSDERTYAHKLRYLRPDESWQLFREKAFQKIKMDEGFEKLGKEIVQKCDGLPLAIIVLAGLLSTKKPQEWLGLRDHIWGHLENDSIEISFLLALSFDYLPYQLKQCFLYLGVFPEDFEIDMEELIHLLVAEGFIQHDENCIMEEKAKDYLDELVNRSLLQVETKHWKENATCRVHDLLRDLAVKKARDMHFLYIYDEDKHSNISSIISSCSRQSVYSTIKNSSWLEQSNPRLCSLFLFDEERQLVPAMCKKFKSLRVLNVGSKGQRTITEEVEKFIHLKYLKIEHSMPCLDLSSLKVFKLQRLQTLRVCGNVKLPEEIGNMRELRHLIGNFSNELLPIDSLEKLQTLKFIDVRAWVEIQTEKLVHLRDLGISTREKFFFDSVTKLKSLRNLSVSLEREPFNSFEPLSEYQHLVQLRLKGRIRNLREDIHEFLPNLECLSLWKSNLDDDPMPQLEKLPNLRILDLRYRVYSGEKMLCSANGFPRLEILQIKQIRELQVEEGAFPSLRSLTIPKLCKLITSETTRSRIQKTLV